MNGFTKAFLNWLPLHTFQVCKSARVTLIRKPESRNPDEDEIVRIKIIVLHELKFHNSFDGMS